MKLSGLFAMLLVSLCCVAAQADTPLSFDVFDAAPPAATSSGAALDFDVFGCRDAIPPPAIEANMFDVFSCNEQAPLLPVPQKVGGYPIREMRWSGLPKDRLGAVVHLSTGEHAGVFDLKWLATLTWAELDSLHSDHHEGCVSSAAKLAKPAVPPPPRITSTTPAKSQQQSCAYYWNGRQYVLQCR